MDPSKLTIVRTIFLMNNDPQLATALVEYRDGRLGIVSNGHAVGSPWSLGNLPRCVAKFLEVANPDGKTVFREQATAQVPSPSPPG